MFEGFYFNKKEFNELTTIVALLLIVGKARKNLTAKLGVFRVVNGTS